MQKLRFKMRPFLGSSGAGMAAVVPSVAGMSDVVPDV
jgi:hypothetical protein